MCGVAANVTDAILPSAPVRQWVLSLPFELRGLAATKPDVLTALGRIFAEEVERVTKRLAGVAGAETGSISFPQRFGGSLNLHVHYHLLAIDGCFEKQGEGVRMHEAPPPAKTDVAEVARRVHDRALAWLRRHRYLDERPAEDRKSEPAAETLIEALARLALAGGTFVGRPFPAAERAGDEDLDRKEPRFSAPHSRRRAVRCVLSRRVGATVEPATVKKILAHLGLPTEPPPRARAREPTGQESVDEGAA